MALMAHFNSLPLPPYLSLEKESDILPNLGLSSDLNGN